MGRMRFARLGVIDEREQDWPSPAVESSFVMRIKSIKPQSKGWEYMAALDTVL